jgi:hypothetical protein
MLHLRTSTARPTEAQAPRRRADRAMDVIQYAMAFLAIGAAILLGSVR